MSTSTSLETFACHRCGYDLRMHPSDGVCPECETPVAESREFAKIPRRPAWRDADPRWRRRMVAGAWVLVFVPLVAVLQAQGWDESIPVPTFFRVQGTMALNDSYVEWVYEYLTFCIGVVLLFAKERNRHRNPIDWTKRWGVIASYGVAALGFAQFVLLAALVIAGIAAMCQSMPRSEQPAATELLVTIGTTLIYYGPQPSRFGDAALPAFSGVVVLLACVPLFDALRSTGSKIWAFILLAPLALAAVLQIGLALEHAVRPGPLSTALYSVFYYFNVVLLAGGFAEAKSWSLGAQFISEAVKWLSVLAIAVWLSIAQFAALFRRRRIAA